jgi:hypothetical protein
MFCLLSEEFDGLMKKLEKIEDALETVGLRDQIFYR